MHNLFFTLSLIKRQEQGFANGNVNVQAMAQKIATTWITWGIDKIFGLLEDLIATFKATRIF